MILTIQNLNSLSKNYEKMLYSEKIILQIEDIYTIKIVVKLISYLFIQITNNYDTR